MLAIAAVKGRGKQIGVDEIQAVGHPVFHQSHFIGVAAANRSAPAPLRVLARLRLSNKTDLPVDLRVDVGGCEMGAAKFLVAIDPFLPEIWIGKHSPPPGVSKKIGAAGRGPNTWIRIAAIRGTQGAIKIPDGTESYPAVSRFVKIGA